jgi:hypothetical protein
MPKWSELVATHLHNLRLPPERRDEVIEEIAAHLEETSREALANGADEQQARERALAEVTDWRQFASDIRKAKQDEMSDRARRVLLPGMACFLAAALLERLLYAVRVWPKIIRVGHYGFFPVNWTWLLMLLFCGAAAAYFARRAGASTRQRLLAATLPVLAPAALFVVGACIALVAGFIMPSRSTPATVVLQGFAGYVLGSVIIPGAALAIGTVPFLWTREKRAA